MAKGKIGGFLIHLILLTVLFLSLIRIVFSFHAKMLIGEFLLLLFFILIAFVAMAGKAIGSNWGNGGLLFLYGLNMINFLFIYGIANRFPLWTMVIAVLGFIVALFGFKGCGDDDFDDFEEIKPAEEEKTVTTSFEPGKYVASKTGKKFHAPKCDWAKRIKKKSQIWFNDKDEAKKQKYKACDCVK